MKNRLGLTLVAVALCVAGTVDAAWYGGMSPMSNYSTKKSKKMMGIERDMTELKAKIVAERVKMDQYLKSGNKHSAEKAKDEVIKLQRKLEDIQKKFAEVQLEERKKHANKKMMNVGKMVSEKMKSKS